MRQELKFISSYSRLRRILQEIRAYHHFNPRMINSIYFDTDEMQHYLDSEEGSVPRQKVRFRWYGDKPQPDRGIFEIKKTFATFRDKDLIPFEVSALPAMTTFCSQFSGEKLTPMVKICYQREYFQDQHKNRFTVDRAIQYYRCDRDYNLYLQKSESLCVLECKLNLGVDEGPLVEKFGDIRSRFSKYCEAIRACYGEDQIV